MFFFFFSCSSVLLAGIILFQHELLLALFSDSLDLVCLYSAFALEGYAHWI